MKFSIVLFIALFVLPVQAEDLPWETALTGDNRSADNSARDDSRHPHQTLNFFRLPAGMTVAEIAPGGGWYTEILAPLLKDNGKYYAAHYSANGPGWLLP